jgi:hypothetical protein
MISDHLWHRLLAVRSKFLELSPLTREDIPFLFELRTTASDNYLKPIAGEISEQYAYFDRYLERFARREEIYYKIFDRQQKRYCGLVRLTEIDDPHVFNWQSLIVKKGSSPQIGIDCMVVIYSLGFEVLQRASCGPWLVDRRFEAIFKIHRFQDVVHQVSEDAEFIGLAVKRERFYQRLDELRKKGLGVINL